MKQFIKKSIDSSPYPPSQSPPEKPKNILIRHSCSKKIKFSPYEHPEASYILKYSPKYYNSLTLQATRQSPLLSKVKKIKKLKGFTGLYSDENFPQKLWFNLLANTRKEIEEIPKIEPNKLTLMVTGSSWKKLSLQKVKAFPNLTRLSQPRWEFDFNALLHIKEYFVKYLWNMRRLKDLKFLIRDDLYDETKWVILRLNKMSRVLGQLETFSMEIKTVNQNFIQELQENTNVFSHLTRLDFPEEFHLMPEKRKSLKSLSTSINLKCQELREINNVFSHLARLDLPEEYHLRPEKCKKLKSLSFNLKNSKDRKPEIFMLLTSLQQLTQLQRIELSWPEDVRFFWDNFKPHSSLRYLTLRFNALDLINENYKDVASHWEQIHKLDILELKILCNSMEEITLARFLITKILEKIRKIRQLKVTFEGSFDPLGFQACCEPFLVEEVPHLYLGLERFEYSLSNTSKGSDVKVDLKMTKLKFFRNLLEVKLDGNGVYYEGLDKIVDLLQKNQKEERDYPMLEINVESKTRPSWFRDTLQRISNIKRMDRNVKITMNLALKMDRFRHLFVRSGPDLLQVLQGLCEDIQAVKTIKGLTIYLNLHDPTDFSTLPVEKLKEIMSKYHGIRNLNVFFKYLLASLEYIHMDGQKTQFITSAF